MATQQIPFPRRRPLLQYDPEYMDTRGADPGVDPRIQVQSFNETAGAGPIVRTMNAGETFPSGPGTGSTKEPYNYPANPNPYDPFSGNQSIGTTRRPGDTIGGGGLSVPQGITSTVPYGQDQNQNRSSTDNRDTSLNRNTTDNLNTQRDRSYEEQRAEEEQRIAEEQQRRNYEEQGNEVYGETTGRSLAPEGQAALRGLTTSLQGQMDNAGYTQEEQDQLNYSPEEQANYISEAGRPIAGAAEGARQKLLRYSAASGNFNPGLNATLERVQQQQGRDAADAYRGAKSDILDAQRKSTSLIGDARIRGRTSASGSLTSLLTAYPEYASGREGTRNTGRIGVDNTNKIGTENTTGTTDTSGIDNTVGLDNRVGTQIDVGTDRSRGTDVGSTITRPVTSTGTVLGGASGGGGGAWGGKAPTATPLTPVAPPTTGLVPPPVAAPVTAPKPPVDPMNPLGLKKKTTTGGVRLNALY